jgi:hypothetical protein
MARDQDDETVVRPQPSQPTGQRFRRFQGPGGSERVEGWAIVDVFRPFVLTVRRVQRRGYRLRRRRIFATLYCGLRGGHDRDRLRRRLAVSRFGGARCGRSGDGARDGEAGQRRQQNGLPGIRKARLALRLRGSDHARIRSGAGGCARSASRYSCW